MGPAIFFLCIIIFWLLSAVKDSPGSTKPHLLLDMAREKGYYDL